MSYQVSRLTTKHSWHKGWQISKCHLPLDTLAVLQLPGSYSTVFKGLWNWSYCEKTAMYRAGTKWPGEMEASSWDSIQWRLSATLQNIGIMSEPQEAQRRGCHFFCLFVFTMEVIYLDFIFSFTLGLQFDRTNPCNVKQNSKLMVIFKYIKACHGE